MFENASALTLYCVLCLLVFAGIQFLLCCRIKHKALLHAPAALLLAAWVFTLLMAMGAFGTDGGGFLGNMHLLGAAILAIVFLPATLGIVLGWAACKLYRKAKTKNR